MGSLGGKEVHSLNCSVSHALMSGDPDVHSGSSIQGTCAESVERARPGQPHLLGSCSFARTDGTKRSEKKVCAETVGEVPDFLEHVGY